ncbi:PRMT5 arginine-N-methyltransferase-domain-containing protein [Calycina marina]|uniref:Protein arginine N-methyltransferase n=1 Tax=Calycina marina TaxID=1763456 RepID=A0A9P8CG73_9HELO|nr:PRMT5 arginine-N-methyltransferase-domain-containing protein [Calycina marina]
MATMQQPFRDAVGNDDEGPSSPIDDYIPTFYIGHHEAQRPLPITEPVLRQAQDNVGYDMLTSPITSPHFHSRVLTLISSHLSDLAVFEAEEGSLENGLPPPPIIPPLNPVDTPLSPGETLSQLIGYCSPWIDLASPDPLIANISRQVLNIEVAYASFCGLGNLIIPAPKTFGCNATESDGLARYARAIQEALHVGSYVNIAIHIPMYGNYQGKEMTGDLAALARKISISEEGKKNKEIDLFETWDAWNTIRSVCKYSSRLSVALALPRLLPTQPLQDRWFAEPLKLLSFTPQTFLKNKNGHPVLSRAHQSLITKYMRLKNAPWLLLEDVGPIPGLDGRLDASDAPLNIVVGTPTPDSITSPTPAEATSKGPGEKRPHSRVKDVAPHLVYLRWLQRNQPARNIIEKFGQGYQDYLQAPLQPLTDNLESVTYEVFEKDPVKYDNYELAIVQALADWLEQGKPTSSTSGAVVIAVAGSGRGPLVTRALKASQTTGVPVELWAVEKNPNAYVLLQRHNEEDWGGVVNVVKSDMRAWKGPLKDISGPVSSATTTNSSGPASPYGKVDILVSELLGSFADNELSPECLDGVQHVLAPQYGISIPSSYTSHLTPILAPRLHADISHRAINDPEATETPYVVMLHAIDYVATSVPDHPRFQQSWEFVHPLPASTLAIAEARRGGGVSGGGGGSMAGGDGANEHNVRYARHTFVCKDRGVVNGIAGYFEAVLYDGGEGGKVELSTRPDTIDAKSRDMISWFPIYFPIKTPLYFPDDSEIDISVWRQTDDRKVWYEWVVDAYVMMGPSKRMRLGTSEVGSSRRVGCLM